MAAVERIGGVVAQYEISVLGNHILPVVVVVIPPLALASGGERCSLSVWTGSRLPRFSAIPEVLTALAEWGPVRPFPAGKHLCPGPNN